MLVHDMSGPSQGAATRQVHPRLTTPIYRIRPRQSGLGTGAAPGIGPCQGPHPAPAPIGGGNYRAPVTRGSAGTGECCIAGRVW